MKPKYFTDQEVDIIRSIFRRLEPKTIESVQIFIKQNTYRTGCTMAVYNKWRKPVCMFQNFENLSLFRMKLLMRLADKITYPLHIKKINDDIMCVGWKIEK